MERVTNITIRRRMGLEPVSSLVRERRLRLFGYIANQCAKSDSKLVTQATMHHSLLGWKRQQGQPRSTSLRAVEDDLKTANLGLHSDWKKAQNRDA